jgi:methionyl-tRNA formyltransferase
MKIGFFGTPNHSKKLLEAIHKSGFEISFVVTNMDKPFGRDKKITPSPVKIYALEKNLTLLQYPSLKTDSAISEITSQEADIYIVFAFGHIIPKKIFDAPKLGTINLHGSLLPKYRGASPVQQAILDGEKLTGISLQYITEELDAGDIILSNEVEISIEDNSETLLAKLTEKGIESILEILKKNPLEKFQAKKQDHTKASFCKKIKPEDKKLNLNLESIDLYNQYRALYPTYIPFLNFRNSRLNIHQLKLDDTGIRKNSNVGEIYFITKKSIGLVCKDGKVLILERVQPENKKVMQVSDFINGMRILEGEKFS